MLRMIDPGPDRRLLVCVQALDVVGVGLGSGQILDGVQVLDGQHAGGGVASSAARRPFVTAAALPRGIDSTGRAGGTRAQPRSVGCAGSTCSW
jgi:hypothetical protein